VNEVFVSLGIESWKPVLSALFLPPAPLLVLVLFGARLIPWSRGLGWLVVLLSVAGLWLTSCSAVGEWLQQFVLSAPPPLSADRLTELKRTAPPARGGIAIVILGGGREARSPEYGVASLAPLTLERLRYGLWLGRETGAPVLFSGGMGFAAAPGRSEADIAADIAAHEFGRPVRWIEARSRDTRESGQFSTSVLRDQGIRQLILVTHGWHMPRAQRAFADAAQRESAAWEIVPAPMGLAQAVERPSLRWMPSGEGFQLVRAVVREKLGWWLGA
jgi:uncharacterized SAM-binding protein YcdF (DUF218 family)